MRCPKCGYHSFDFLDQCKKCGGDLTEHKAKFGLGTVVNAAVIPSAAVAAAERTAEPAVDENVDFGFGLLDEEVVSAEAPPAAEEPLFGGEEDPFSFDAPTETDEAGLFGEDSTDFSFDAPAEPDSEGFSEPSDSFAFGPTEEAPAQEEDAFSFDMEEPPSGEEPSVAPLTDTVEDLDESDFAEEDLDSLDLEDLVSFEDEESSSDKEPPNPFDLPESALPQETPVHRFEAQNRSEFSWDGTLEESEEVAVDSPAAENGPEEPLGAALASGEAVIPDPFESDPVPAVASTSDPFEPAREPADDLFIDPTESLTGTARESADLLKEDPTGDGFFSGDTIVERLSERPDAEEGQRGDEILADPFDLEPITASHSEVLEGHIERSDEITDGFVTELPDDAFPQAAPVSSRLVAGLIDLVLLALVASVFVSVAELAMGSSGLVPSMAVVYDMAIPYFLVLFGVFFGYFTLLHFLAGQTLGKMLCRIRVEGLSGGTLSLSQAFLRSVGGLLSTLIVGLGYLLVLIDRNRRGWNDRLAGTRVVSSRPVAG